MSNTSHGFVHYHEAVFLQNHGQGGRPKSWAERLPELIRHDFDVPRHITMTAAEPLIMGCNKCGRKASAFNPHGAVNFLDSHRYCGNFEVPVWICSRCGTLEDPKHPTCRFCESSGPAFLSRPKMEYYSSVLDQEKEFYVEQAGTVTGTIKAGSLREVLRAVRGWYPHEVTTVRCEGIGTWTTDHVCK